jgi:hypothetical protein
MKLTTEKIGDARIDLDVDGHGTFSAEFNDQRYTAKTREELVEQLKKAVKKASQQGAVDVTVLGIVESGKQRGGYSSDGPFKKGGGFVQAKLRARHERQHNTWLLVTDDDRFASTKFQVGSYSHDGDIVRRLTIAEAMEYMKLIEAERVAKTALEDFVGAVKLDVDAALEAARK